MAEIEFDGDFDDCYDSDDSTNGRECALLIEPKHYILFTYSLNGNYKSFIWIAQNKDDWELEYQHAYDAICDRFAIERVSDHSNVKLENAPNNETINNGEDLPEIWDDLIQNESEKYVTIKVETVEIKVRKVV